MQELLQQSEILYIEEEAGGEAKVFSEAKSVASGVMNAFRARNWPVSETGLQTHGMWEWNESKDKVLGEVLAILKVFLSRPSAWRTCESPEGIVIGLLSKGEEPGEERTESLGSLKVTINQGAQVTALGDSAWKLLTLMSRTRETVQRFRCLPCTQMP